MAKRAPGHHWWQEITTDLHGRTTARDGGSTDDHEAAFALDRLLRSLDQFHDRDVHGVVTPPSRIHMKKFHWRSTVSDVPTDLPSPPASDHPDLAVRNLLDDPRLRRAMGLDGDAATSSPAAPAGPGVAGSRPEPVFNRRRLLGRDAA